MTLSTKRWPPPQALEFNNWLWGSIFLSFISLCDNDIASQSNGEMSELSTIERMARLSNEHLYFDALWVKVVRTLISSELVSKSYNVAVSLCCVLWNVTSLSLSRISSFKMSLRLLTDVCICLYDLSITWSLKYNIWRTSQTDFSPYLQYLLKMR